MPRKEDKRLQKGLIITDDVSINPILDFNLYRDAIVNIVRGSFPKFTIGIFGDWGTGKTTLLNSIDKVLQTDKDLIIVRFESWRYEREEQFALIPLLKTIAFALPDEKEFSDLKQKLKRGAINFAKKTPDIISSIISKYISDDIGKLSEEAFDSLKKEFNSKIELLAEIDKDTLYFDGFEGIKKEIQKLFLHNPNFKIVVFIDDLDRCSPFKTLEVLESIKVFLGMEGFIYILGLSHDIVSKLIDIEYEKSGVKGDQYIKKMIQIPITLPRWNTKDIVKLVKDLIEKGIVHDNYTDLVDKNVELIAIAIENNPREIKRFLNNFIVAYEVFSNTKDFKAEELLVLQAIQLRWNKFYNLLINSDKDFLNEINKYSVMDEEQRSNILDLDVQKSDTKSEIKIRKMLRDFKTDAELWLLLAKNIGMLNNIHDWNVYRRATEIGAVPSILKEPITIDTTPLCGSKGSIWEIPYEQYANIQDFLDDIYFSLPPKTVPVLTYGKKWVLKDNETGKKLFDIGRRTNHAQCIDDGHKSDLRSIFEAGIRPGMRLSAIKLL